MKNHLHVAAFVFLSAMFFTSCFDSATNPANNGACNAGREDVAHRVVIDDALTILPHTGSTTPGNIAYYLYSGGTASYYIHTQQANICTKEHLNINFQAVFSNPANDPIEFKIYGEVFYSIIFKPYIEKLLDGTISASPSIQRTVSVGLKQAFPDKPAEINIYLNVEFPSKGTSSADHAYFRKYIDRLMIDYTYDKHK